MEPRRLPWRERWQPQRLGASLPLAPRLRRWALGLAAVALVALVALVLALRALGTPRAEPAAADAVERAVLDRLARFRSELPVWDPGGELPAVEPPEYLPPPAPPLALRPHPGDPRLSGDLAAVLPAIAEPRRASPPRRARSPL